MIRTKVCSLVKQLSKAYPKSITRISYMALSTRKPEDFVNNPGPNDIVTFEERYPPKQNKILNDVLEAVGNTPLVRLNKIPQSFGVKCQILAKCEYFNPGGSIKDRIVLRMTNDAEKQGRLEKGGIIIEPSSGNTAVSLGLVSAVRGYKSTITIADKNAGEKITTMKALGLDVIKTSSACKHDDPGSYFSVAARLTKETPGAITLNQYGNISNALANYDQTAEEILEACENKIDAVVCGAGTGGTITGIGAKIKEVVPTCKVVGIDPVGSTMADPEDLNVEPGKSYKVEGMGHDFIPDSLVKKHVDTWVKTRDPESLDLARRMIKEEGLLIGASSGAILYGAIKYALDNNLNENQRVVIVLPDSIRNYMTKFASDDWMVDFGFLPTEHYLDKNNKLYGKTVKDLKLTSVKSYTNQITIKEALEIFDKGAEEIVLEKDGQTEGVIYASNFISTYYEKGLKPTDTLKEVNPQKVPVLTPQTDLSVVSKLLERHKIVLAQGSELYRITPKDLLKLSA